MRCQKCGGKHIRASTCVMCGAIVQSLETVAARCCPSCGRTRRFVGLCCADCARAAALGAVSIRENLRRIFREDGPRPGYCPAAEWLEMYAIRYRRRNQRFYATLRYHYWSDEKKAVHIRQASEWRKRNPERARENQRRYREQEEIRQRTKEYNRIYNARPDVCKRNRIRRRRRYYEDSEFRARKNARDRASYARRRAEMLAAREAGKQPDRKGKVMENVEKNRGEENGKCSGKTEVYSRVCGFYRPVTQWNKGKKEEFRERAVYDEGRCIAGCGGACCRPEPDEKECPET